MALPIRPAGLAAAVLSLVPVAAQADTSNIVFPVAGPVVKWVDDYGTMNAGTRQLGNAIRVKPGTPVVAAAAGRVRMLWRGGGGWSLTLTTPDGNRFVYLHLGKDGNRKTAYHPRFATALASPRHSASAGAATPAARRPRRHSSGSSTCLPAARRSIPTSCSPAPGGCPPRRGRRPRRPERCG